MAQTQTGDAHREYNETCALIRHYASKLVDGGFSYADLLRNIDRMAELRDKAKKLWGDR